jgi:hypothetical protein
MRFRLFLALLALPLALASAASCAALVPNTLTDGSDSSGAGGAPLEDTGSEATSAASGSGSGSGGGYFTSGGAGGAVSSPTAPYEYLCGGSHAMCEPGAKTDTCAQGGCPGMGGCAAADSGAVSCQVVAAQGSAGVTAQCGVSGSAGDGDPCMSAADCGPELGCIAGLTPICRPYCCDSLESCPTETYCVTAAMNETPYSPIPVCEPVTTCVLLDDTTCPKGETCAIVRTSGTTSCVVPGAGTNGQACPCAAGFTCSWADNTCLQLCHTGSVGNTECGANEFCQGGTKPYPDGIGYCVSYG